MRLPTLPPVLGLMILLLGASPAFGAFCKCICFQKAFSIVPIYRPSDPSHPCISCTKQFCLDQQLDICQGAEIGDVDLDVATGEEGDVQARCFERDSVMAKTAIISFLLVTTALLASAALKERYPAFNLERYMSSGASHQTASSRTSDNRWFSILQR